MALKTHFFKENINFSHFENNWDHSFLTDLWNPLICMSEPDILYTIPSTTKFNCCHLLLVWFRSPYNVSVDQAFKMCLGYQGDSNQGTVRSTMGEEERYYCGFSSKPPQEANKPHAGRLIIKSVRNDSFITFSDGVGQSHKANSDLWHHLIQTVFLSIFTTDIWMALYFISLARSWLTYDRENLWYRMHSQTLLTLQKLATSDPFLTSRHAPSRYKCFTSAPSASCCMYNRLPSLFPCEKNCNVRDVLFEWHLYCIYKGRDIGPLDLNFNLTSLSGSDIKTPYHLA